MEQVLSQYPVSQQEVETLVSTLTVFQTQSLLMFGSQALEQLARGNENILAQFRGGQIPQGGKVYETLEKVLKALNFGILFAEAGFFKKLAYGKKAEDLGLEQFELLSKDLTQCYVALKTYEGQVAQYHKSLTLLYDKHLQMGQVLATYQKALIQGCEELETVILQEKNQLLSLPPAVQEGKRMDLQTLEQSLGILQRKQHDFHVSEVIFLQTLPVLQGILDSGKVFLEKLQESFLVALPVFQQGMAVGVARKRQKLQGEALDILEAKTMGKVSQNQGDSGSLSALEEGKRDLLRALGDVVSLDGAWKQALG